MVSHEKCFHKGKSVYAHKYCHFEKGQQDISLLPEKQLGWFFSYLFVTLSQFTLSTGSPLSQPCWSFREASSTSVRSRSEPQGIRQFFEIRIEGMMESWGRVKPQQLAWSSSCTCFLSFWRKRFEVWRSFENIQKSLKICITPPQKNKGCIPLLKIWSIWAVWAVWAA